MRSAPPTAAGNAAQERQAGDAGLGRRAGDLHVGRAGAGADAATGLDRHLAEALAQPDHHAGDAAVAHEEVRAEPDHQDRDRRTSDRRKYARSSSSAGREEHLRRSAGAKPGQRDRGRIGLQGPAQVGHPRPEVGRDVREHHAALSLKAASSPGSA